MNAAQRKLFSIVAATLLASPLPVFGHTAGLSTSDAQFVTNGLQVKLTVALVDLNSVLSQFDGTQPFDANGDRHLTPDELNAAVRRLKTFAIEALAVEFDGQLIGPATPILKLDENNNFEAELNYPGSKPGRLVIRARAFQHLPDGHRHFVSVRDLDGTELGNRMLYPIDNSLELNIGQVAAVERPQARRSSFEGFLLLGIKHIWTGYDHLLFLLAVLLVCDRFKPAVQVVTCFTLAHSLTLALATFNLVTVSSRVVEPMIAASIVYVGVENFLVPQGRKGRWQITFFFGLIHGLGFATILREMGVSASAAGATLPLVAFNLGVEVGQLVIASVLLPLIWNLRGSPLFVKKGLPACSAIVAAMGAYWLIQRLWFV
jgi:hydrogenase/urease accessory protein HupE